MLSGSLAVEQYESAIAEIDVRLALGAPDPALFVDRGRFLELLGRKDDAVSAYVDALRIEPTYVDALIALGLLFMAVGNRDAARTMLSGAVLHGPTHAPAHANLAYLYSLDNHLSGARALYEHALTLDPKLAIAHHGLADVLPRLGEADAAARHRLLGLRYRPITIERYEGDGQPIRVLALGTAAHGNVPTYGYFDNRVFSLSTLAVEYADPATPLPPHDLVFNAIGEADLCADQLARATAIAARTTAPIVNHPAAVAATTRAANAERFRRLEGVVTPRIVTTDRATLADPAARDLLLARNGLAFPLLVRSPGYHTGDHFVRVDRAGDLPEAIAPLPGDELLLIEYLDVRDAGGAYRKYRAIIVNGKWYPLHLAISHVWKVHYFSAAMAESADYRAADAAYLRDMPGTLGARALAALEQIRVALALDYGGIDFALDAAGNVIVFEANASMIVPSPGPEAIWNYRRGPVAQIRAAVRTMLYARAGLGAVAPASAMRYKPS